MASGLPLMQGTLDLLILGAIRAAPSHGYGIATTIEERSAGQLRVEDAALYQALHRLERQGYVEAEWGASDNNRRAKFYALTPDGRRRLAAQKSYWRRYTRALDALLRRA
jgi:PadR family transcriptional regulator PadR